jgi:hypothetical protein
MPGRRGRVTEHEVAAAVLRYLSDNYDGEATIEQIVEGLPTHIALDERDRRPSLTRPNEELWEQQVRNIVSHRNTPGNAICEGLLEYLPRGDDRHGRLRITGKGRMAQQRLL